MFWTILLISILGGGGVSSPFGSGGMNGSGSGTGYTPCVPSQRLCSLQCVNGYVIGPAGCDFCLCNNNAQSVTTIGPVLIDPVDSKVTTTVSSQMPSETTNSTAQTTALDCMAAKLRCSSNCGDKGYLVDPSDYTCCLKICKSS